MDLHIAQRSVMPFSHLLPGTAAGETPKSSQQRMGHVCSHMRECETGGLRGLFSKGSAENVLRGWGVERALCTLVWVSPPWTLLGGWGLELGGWQGFCTDNGKEYYFLCIYCMCVRVREGERERKCRILHIILTIFTGNSHLINLHVILYVLVSCQEKTTHMQKKQTELQQNREVSFPANCHICTSHFPIFQQPH